MRIALQPGSQAGENLPWIQLRKRGPGTSTCPSRKNQRPPGSGLLRGQARITVDDQVRLDRTLAAGGPGQGPWKTAHHLDQWNVWVSDYDEEISIEVPAGRHDVTFANIEGDWLQIRSLLLPRYRSSRYPAVDALGLASDRQLLLWFHNQESTWRTEHDGKTPAKLEAIRARVPARGRDLAGGVVEHEHGRGRPTGNGHGRKRRADPDYTRLQLRRGGTCRALAGG